MGLETIGYVYTGPDQTGRSMMIGIAQGDRYYPEDGQALGRDGFFDQIHSGSLQSSPRKDVSITLFWTQYFDANFLQMTSHQSDGGFTFWCDPIRSFLITTSSPGGAGEVRVSYRDMFVQQWKTFIEAAIEGDGRRNVEPIINWEMFPAYSPYLDRHHTYLKVHQELLVFTPWPYPDYHVSLDYWIYLFPSGRGVRCTIPQYAWWVEGGALTDRIRDKFVPKVIEGAAKLRDKLNEQLAQFDGLIPNGVHDVYYQPGRQLQSAQDTRGLTTDDVTIVIALN